MRAYLTVPPGSTDRAVGLADAADALVFDGRDLGTCAAVESLRQGPERPHLLVRIGRVGSPGLETHLGALVASRPDALVLPAEHGRDVAHLGALLAVHEAEEGLTDGVVGIVALVASARAALDAASFVGASPRLSALAWSAEALAEQLGAASPTVSEGWIAPLMQVRCQTRLAAAAAGLAAIEAACSIGDERFRAVLAAARRDGFSAMMARDPAQAVLIRAEG